MTTPKGSLQEAIEKMKGYIRMAEAGTVDSESLAVI